MNQTNEYKLGFRCVALLYIHIFIQHISKLFRKINLGNIGHM